MFQQIHITEAARHVGPHVRLTICCRVTLGKLYLFDVSCHTFYRE